ncbi:Hint domain-containing protein [Corallococcus terminator]
MRRFLMMGCTTGLALLSSGCTSAPRDEQVANFGRTLQGLGDASRLTKAEWATYQSDQGYLHRIAKPDVRIRLNLADPAQYRFALARLKLAGKTPANSPYLFEAMETRHREHVALGYKPGLLPLDKNVAENSVARQEQHAIIIASAGEGTDIANDGLGTSLSSFPNGSFYTYTDTTYTDTTGFPLGELSWSEEYDQGTNVTANALGDLSLTRLTRYRIASYKVEDSVEGFQDSYLFKEVGSEVETDVNQVPRLHTPVILAPLDIKNNDNIISICLNRTWTNDCDYDLTGNDQSVKLPLQGSVAIKSDHIFDAAAINQYKADLNNNVARPDSGHIKLILAKAGGGCDVTDANTLQARMGQFWNRVSLSTDKKTLSWDLTETNAAFFDDGCRLVQDSVTLTAQITLPLQITSGPTTKKAQSSITLTSDPASRQPYKIKRIIITNSCLAAGTEIELAAGKVAPIESVKAGDQVRNPHQPALTVMDTAIGVEAVPMVRIRSEAGRSLLMTEMHPIQVLARGMVQAKALKKGDVVMTRTGPSKLVEVSREPYAGKVYNVKVGSDAEKLALAADQTVVYANGFVVGDGQIQQKYESIAMTRKDGDVLAHLPKKWHRDYQMAARRK